MASIKIEAQEPSLPSISTDSLKSERDSRMQSPIDKEWEARMELALLNAIARCKPVGMHKHFRIMNVQRRYNEEANVHCSIKDIWDRLSEYYGSLDELEEEDEEEEEEEREEQVKQGGDSLNEFSLPLDDYEQLISEHRQDDQYSAKEESPEPSPAPSPAKRTRTSKRDASPAVNTTDSVTSTPEPEEGKPSRRASRSTRKSDAGSEQTPAGRPPSSRRSSKASSSAAGTRGSRRQTKKK